MDIPIVLKDSLTVTFMTPFNVDSSYAQRPASCAQTAPLSGSTMFVAHQDLDSGHVAKITPRGLGRRASRLLTTIAVLPCYLPLFTYFFIDSYHMCFFYGLVYSSLQTTAAYSVSLSLASIRKACSRSGSQP